METRDKVRLAETRVTVLPAGEALHESPRCSADPSEAVAIPADTSGGNSSFSFVILAGLVVIATVLRLLATRNDLWLDEIISLRSAQGLRSPWDIFRTLHSDNNHYLNTLYLYVVRRQSYTPVFRYLSVVCGVALVPAGYWLVKQRSRLEGLILAALLACSYPLIHFSSEARGYSGALLGLVVACAALMRWMAAAPRQNRFSMGCAYGAGVVLAVLSHLTAGLIWVALATGSLITIAGKKERGKTLVQWVAINSLPASAIGALYWIDLRYLTELGGPPMTVMHGFARLLALGLGWPGRGAATVWIVVAPLLALAVWQLARDWKAGEPLAILLIMIFLTPLACVAVLRPAFFSPRYFLVVLPFLYAMGAMLLARMVGTRVGRIGLAAVLLLFVAGQAGLYVNFLRLGRGGITAALEFMAEHTPSERMVVISNQDFRANAELAYFAPRMRGSRQVVYVPTENRKSFPAPDWYIFHGEGYDPPGPEALVDGSEVKWRRVAYFGAVELSGQAWTLYQRTAQ